MSHTVHVENVHHSLVTNGDGNHVYIFGSPSQGPITTFPASSSNSAISNGRRHRHRLIRRDDVMEKIDSSLHQKGAKHTVFFRPYPAMVLCGSAGMGKTFSVQMYAQSTNKKVAWINANTFDSTKTSFEELGRHFQIPVPGILTLSIRDLVIVTSLLVMASSITTGIVSGAVFGGPLGMAVGAGVGLATFFLLQNIFQKMDDELKPLTTKFYDHCAQHMDNNVLVVFDDARAMTTTLGNFGIEKYLPQGNQPSIIITTRNSDRSAWPAIPMVMMNEFTKEQIERYLFEALGLDQSDSGLVKKYANLFPGYPMALVEAVNRITFDHHHSPNDGRYEVEQKLEKFLLRYDQTVAAMTQINGKKIIKRGEGNPMFEIALETILNPILASISSNNFDDIFTPIFDTHSNPPSKELGRSGDLNFQPSSNSKHAKMALNLFSLTSFMPPNHLNVELCYHIQHKIRVNPHNRKKSTAHLHLLQQSDEWKGFKILEQQSIISMTPLEKDDRFGSYFVTQVIMSKFMQEGAQQYSHQNDDSSSPLLNDYVQYLMENDVIMAASPLCPEYFGFLHGRLKMINWPERTYRQATYFALRRCLNGTEAAGGDGGGIQCLRDIFEYLKKIEVDHPDFDPQYLNLCQLALVLCARLESVEFKKEPFFGRGASHRLDNSNLFPGVSEREQKSAGIYLRSVSLLELLEFAVDQATTYNDNEVMQWIVCRICFRLIGVRSIFSKADTRNKVMKWIKAYLDMVAEGKKLLKLQESTHTLTIMILLGVKIDEGKKFQVTLTIRRIIESTIKNYDDTIKFDFWAFLRETLWSLGCWPGNAWDDKKGNEKIYLYYHKPLLNLIGGTSYSKNFLMDGGLPLIIQGLTVVQANIEKDNWLSSNDEELLFRIMELAYFEECAKILLNSDDFVEKLKTIFDTAKRGLHADSWGLVALDLVLLTHLSLFVVPGRKGQLTEPRYALNDLEICLNFYTQQGKLREGKEVIKFLHSHERFDRTDKWICRENARQQIINKFLHIYDTKVADGHHGYRDAICSIAKEMKNTNDKDCAQRLSDITGVAAKLAMN